MSTDLVSATLGQNVIFVNVSRFRILALVDSGAYYSIISDKFLAKLGLPIARLEDDDF